MAIIEHNLLWISNKKDRISLSYQKGRIVIQSLGLNRTHFRPYRNPGHEFPTLYVAGIFCVQRVNVRGDFFVCLFCFVDISEIVDHHCLNYIFIRQKSIFSIPNIQQQQCDQLFRKCSICMSNREVDPDIIFVFRSQGTASLDHSCPRLESLDKPWPRLESLDHLCPRLRTDKWHTNSNDKNLMFWL